MRRFAVTWVITSCLTAACGAAAPSATPSAAGPTATPSPLETGATSFARAIVSGDRNETFDMTLDPSTAAYTPTITASSFIVNWSSKRVPGTASFQVQGRPGFTGAKEAHHRSLSDYLQLSFTLYDPGDIHSFLSPGGVLEKQCTVTMDRYEEGRFAGSVQCENLVSLAPVGELPELTINLTVTFAADLAD